MTPPLEFFTEKSFNPHNIVGYFLTPEDAKNIANYHLNAKLGKRLYRREGVSAELWYREQWPNDTHQCFEFNIEPLKKECAHEKVEILKDVLRPTGKCTNCGVQMQAVWKAVE